MLQSRNQLRISSTKKQIYLIYYLSLQRWESPTETTPVASSDAFHNQLLIVGISRQVIVLIILSKYIMIYLFNLLIIWYWRCYMSGNENGIVILGWRRHGVISGIKELEVVGSKRDGQLAMIWCNVAFYFEDVKYSDFGLFILVWLTISCFLIWTLKMYNRKRTRD
jgi:hypothetical protein